MSCPDENTFLRYAAGRLPAESLTEMDAHLDSCPSCRKVFSSMAVTGAVASQSGGSLRPSTVTQSPDVLSGRYRLGTTLGSGGTGQVYAAEHLRTGRHCAIKFLSDGPASDPDAVERFSREARILGGLEHRGIVSILDFAEAEDGRPYLVMEWLEGEDLADRLDREGAQDWPTVRHLFRQLCQALREAHSHGVLHRDVKPSNIFLTRESDGSERAVLLDFGLAKSHATHEPTLTRTGAIMGTPAYMSPEQARGRPVDERTDVYSLAAVLYQMLSGEAPFWGSTFTDVLAQVLTDAPATLVPRKGSPIPAHVDAVIQVAMAKEPGLRHGSVAELEHRVLDEGAATTAPAGAGRRAKAPWLLAGGFAAALLLGIGVFLWQSPPRTAAPSDPVASATAVNRATTDAPQPDATATRAVPAPRADAGAPARPTDPQPPRSMNAAHMQRPMRARPRARATQPRTHPRTAPRVIAMGPAPRKAPWGTKGDPYITVRGMNGKPKHVRLSQLPATQRAHIRITAYMSRRDWKTCARIARNAPQTRMILYYSIHCHYMSGDMTRTKRLCAQYGKRYPKLLKNIMSCRNVVRGIRFPRPTP